MKNLAGLMKQASQMQSKMAEIQAKLEAMEIEGVSGAGMVQVTLSGKGDLKRVKLDPKLLDPAEAEMVEDLLVAAHADARRKLEAETAAEMERVTGGMQLPGGMKLPVLASASRLRERPRDRAPHHPARPACPDSAHAVRAGPHCVCCSSPSRASSPSPAPSPMPRGRCGPAAVAAISIAATRAPSAPTRRVTTSLICVVEGVGDLWALERAAVHRGLYHVLGGILSALGGVTPEDLNLRPLFARIGEGSVAEVILALGATVDGASTAHYLAERLQPTGVAVTRVAHGVPIGGALDVLDDGTLGAALKARRPV